MNLKAFAWWCLRHGIEGPWLLYLRSVPPCRCRPDQRRGWGPGRDCKRRCFSCDGEIR